MVSDSIDLHPTDLRNRLGKKRPTASSFFKSDHSEFKRRRRRSDEEEREESQIETLISLERSRNRDRRERYLIEGRSDSSNTNRPKKSSRHERRERSPGRNHKKKSSDQSRSPGRNHKKKSSDQSRRSSSHHSKVKSHVHKPPKSARPSRDQVENSNGRTLVRYSPSPFDD